MSNSTSDKEKLKKVLQSAESIDETLKAFREMEACFDKYELGYECFIVADKIFKQGNDPDQVLSFGKKALDILLVNDAHNNTSHELCLLITRVLCLLGSACFASKSYDESLSYLNRADANLSRLDEAEKDNIALYIQIELHNVKAAMGKREEVVFHSKKILEISENVMEEGSVGIGNANKNVALSYIMAFDPEKAEPFCLKALDIFTKTFGRDSVEVAEVSRHLSAIYHKMGKYEKALEFNQLVMAFIREKTPDSLDLLTEETEGANTMIDLGRYQEAVDMLEGVVSREGIQVALRVRSSLIMARALLYLGKFADAKEYMGVAQSKLEETEIEMDPTFIAFSFADMSSLYHMMNDNETAISLTRKCLALPRLPQKFLAELSAALMSLISQAGTGKDEVAYVENEVEKLGVSFGPKHCAVGYAYSLLGAAYMKSGQKDLCVKSLAQAKEILDDTIGPRHLTSLKLSHDLSVAYATLGSYDQALEIEEKVIEGLEGVKPSEQQFRSEVIQHFSDMNDRVWKGLVSVQRRRTSPRQGFTMWHFR